MDALSHLPLQIPDSAIPSPMKSMPQGPLQAAEMASMTAKDPSLGTCSHLGTQKKLAEVFRPFSFSYYELSVQKGRRLVTLEAGH